MFGKFLGEMLSMPIKIVNIPVKIATKLVGEDETDKNILDDAAKVIKDCTEEALDGDGSDD